MQRGEHAVRPRPLPRRSRERRARRISPRTRARSPTTRRACCPTAPCSAPATPGASSRAWRVLRQGAEPEFLTPDDADVEIVALDRIAHAPRLGRSTAAARARCGSTASASRACRTASSRRSRSRPDGSLTVTAGPPEDSTDVWTRRARRAPAHALGGRRARPLGVRAAGARARSRASTAAASPTSASARPGGPALCWVHGGPESQFRPQMAPVIQYLCAQGITVAAPNVRGSTGYGRSYPPPRRRRAAARLGRATSRRSARALGAGGGHARRRDGRLLRRLHDDGRDHRAPGALGVRRQHRRDRQLRDLPRAHRRVPPRAARGRVRLARARPRVPRVDLADPQDRRASPAR